VKIVTIDQAVSVTPANPEWWPGGEVRVQALNLDGGPGSVEALAVFFPAGCRTKPHVHPVDQTLHVVDGEGVVATADERRIIRAGDVVVVPAGVWHWHGATPDSAMCHVSYKLPSQTDWSSPWGDWDTYMEGAA
jgi:quercetin dioxygenase-like cupin family protein